MKMKMIAVLAALVLSATSVNAETKPNGMWTALAGTAVQEIDSGMGAKLGVSIDLYQAGGLFRFNDGLMLGAKVQKGYPNKAYPSESRVEAIVGYSTRINNVMPYVLASYAWRKPDANAVGLKDGNYHWVKTGAKVMVSPKYFVSGAFRFRDSNDYNMRDNTLYYGAGINATKDTTVEFEIGKVKGQNSLTSDSTVTSLIFSKRFF